MGVMSKLRRLLGLVDGNEEKVAKQIGKRTRVSEEKAREGLDKATDALDESSGDGNGN